MKLRCKDVVPPFIAALVLLFSVNVNADWLYRGNIGSVAVSATGDYRVTATFYDSFTRTLIIQSTDPNAKAMLAVILTAHANGNTVSFEYFGNRINQAILVAE